MNKIIQLSNETIAKIAAGEVIERPSFAVKELVENAIDARPKNIEIVIVDSGLTEITVIDDGVGMSKEDLEMALLPHTTSKIHDSSELSTVSTLGFRGEGLSSLAAIADVSLASRPKNISIGHVVESTNSQIHSIKEIGMAPGTRVSAYKLMNNLPARKKFLKSERTEFRHIVEYISEVSLSFPHIHFTLTHNGKSILDMVGNTVSRISEVFGESVANRIMSRSFKNSITTVMLYIGHPENALPSKNKLYMYINNRPVSDQVVTAAIKEAYGKLLDPYSYPVGAVFVSIPPQFVDVNVHPTKREVQFESVTPIFQEILENTRELLASYNLTFGTANLHATNREIASNLRADVSILPISHILDETRSNELIIVDNTYIITPHKDGLILFDQHAAHEALLYEEYAHSFQKHKTESFELPEATLISLTKTQIIEFEEHADVFQQMGFQIEIFGGSTIKVSAIPKLTNEHDIAGHIAEILEYLSSSHYPDIDHINNKMIAFLACKSAIKAGDKLSKNEAFKIIHALNERNSVYTCPHGRPVKRVLSVLELKKMFKRV